MPRQLTRVVRADSVEVEMVYDTAGRPSEVRTPEGTYGITYSSTTGQVVETTSPDSVTLGFTWDGPLLTRTEWSGGVAGSVEVGYDTDFRMAWEVVDDSLEVEYANDGDGLLVQAGDLLLERDTLNGRLVAAELDTPHYSHPSRSASSPSPPGRPSAPRERRS